MKTKNSGCPGRRASGPRPFGPRPAPILWSLFASLGLALLIVAPLPVDASQDEAQPVTVTISADALQLPSGNYRGVWQTEDGLTGDKIIVLDVDGESVSGELRMYGVADGYTGDDITGSVENNGDGTLSVELRTKDGKFRASGIFNGEILVGNYDYRTRDRIRQKRTNGEWAAQFVPGAD